VWLLNGGDICLTGTKLARRWAEQAVEPAEGSRAGTSEARGTAAYPRTGAPGTRDQYDDTATDADADEADAGKTKGQV